MTYPESVLDVPAGKLMLHAHAEALQSRIGLERGWLLQNPILPSPQSSKTGFGLCSSAITCISGMVVPSEQRSTVPSKQEGGLFF